MGTEPLGLTIRQLAEHLQVHEQTARQLVREGRIRSVRVGRRHVVPRAELQRFLEVESVKAD
jgi:excisionase family DNA binding protein